MRCPKCNGDNVYVKETRSAENAVVRRRCCADCGSVFFTEEMLIGDDRGKSVIAEFQKDYARKRREMLM